ncbi:response regulator [Bremerella cremea]|uniref:response regulator n=1 Tax=Bremerella cremea TaxID=1031537 RepID=UPI0031EBED43
MKSILIADDNSDVVDILKRRCEKLGLSVVTADNAMEALKLADSVHPEAIILDIHMPQGNGLTVAEMLSNHEQLHSVPVIILTGSSSEEIIKRCHQLCAYYIPKSTDIWRHIEPVLCELLEINEDPMDIPEMPSDQKLSESLAILDRVFAILGVEANDSPQPAEGSEPVVEQNTPWVLTIEDDEDVAMALKMRLKEVGIIAVHAAEGTAGYRSAFMSAPSAIILDYELPRGNGDYVLRRLKESPVTSSIPVIVLTGRKEPFIERQMRSMGANAFFTKPFQWGRIKQTLEDLLPAGMVH